MNRALAALDVIGYHPRAFNRSIPKTTQGNVRATIACPIVVKTSDCRNHANNSAKIQEASEEMSIIRV